MGSDIAYAAVTKTVSGWRHLRLKTVNLGLSFWLAVGSVPSAIAGVWVIELLHRHYGDSLDEAVLTMLACALILVGVIVLVRSLFIASIVWIGSHLTARMPTGVLRTALGVVLITSSLALFEKAGVDLPTTVIVAIPSALLIGVIAQRLARKARALPAASSSAGSAP